MLKWFWIFNLNKLIFNKQYRTEGELISELEKKINKSLSFKSDDKGNEEIYELDSVCIGFDIMNKKITVSDKAGNKIVSLDCKYDAYDKFQQAKGTWFHYLLCDVARKRKETEEEKQKKLKSMQKAAEALAAATKAKNEQLLQQEATQKALKRIRRL